MGAGLVCAANGIILAFALEIPAALGVSLLGMGFALYRAGIRHICAASEKASRWCTLLGLILTLVGISWVFLGIRGEALVVAALGAFVIALGLTPATIAWLRGQVHPLGAKWRILFGALILVLGLASWPPGRPDYLWWASGLVLGGLGFSFSWRWEGFALVAVAVFAVLWVLRDRADDATPLDPNPSAEHRILALGDSYISGEGSHIFFPGTNVVGDRQNQCRRSPTAFP